MYPAQAWRYLSALQALHSGELIAYPTEAVWGLGCDPGNPAAVAKLLALKQRSVEKGLILVAADVAQLNSLLDAITPAQRRRLQDPCAQPTTWLIPNNGSVPDWICGAHDSVAVRISAHPIVKALCQAFGGMLVSSSANRAGCAPARNIIQARARFKGGVAAYVAGATGSANRPSQIIDVVSGRRLR